jgi:hypothetical protein
VPPIDQRATARPVETAANEPSTEAVIADRWARAADHANRQFGFAK